MLFRSRTHAGVGDCKAVISKGEGGKRDLGKKWWRMVEWEISEHRVLTGRWGKKCTRRLTVRISLDGCGCGYFLSFLHRNGTGHVITQA